MAAALSLALGAGIDLAAPRSAAARAPCGEKVIQDWSDGAISHPYPIACYRQALQVMPEDVRLYSSAAEDIGRALTTRVRSTRRAAALMSAQGAGSAPALAGPARAERVDEGASSAPLTLAGSLAALLAVLVVGSLIAGRTALRRRKRPVRRLQPPGLVR